MRLLSFDPWEQENDDSPILFVNLYNGFIGSADNPNRARTLEETRNAIKILDALDDISDVTQVGAYRTRLLRKTGGSVTLTEDCFNLLQTAVESYVANLPFAMARPGMKLKTFVDAAKKVE